MKEQKEGHQADQLMKLFQEVANHQPDSLEEEDLIEKDETEEQEEYIELDILNLPPRREVHGARKKPMSFSFTSPFVRLSLVIIVLLIVVFILYYFGALDFPFLPF